MKNTATTSTTTRTIMLFSLIGFICSLHNSATADPMIMSSYQHLVGTRESFHKKGALDKMSNKSQQRPSQESHDNGRALRNFLRGRTNEWTKDQNKEHLLYSRRSSDSTPIDYDGKHPYEVMEEHRRRRSSTRTRRKTTTSTNYQSYWYNPKFELDEFLQDDWYDLDDDFDPALGDSPTKFESTEEQNFDWDLFKPIRIRIDSDFLMENFQQDMRKNEFIIYHVLPPAVQFWTKALQVFPAKRLFLQNCQLSSANDGAYGRNDADIVIYLTADMSCTNADEQGQDTKAGAQSCDWDQYDRPIGGVMDFCYRVFELDEHGQASDKLMKEMIEIAIHEMGHILGLTSDDMAFYYDRSTGQPRTTRPLKAAQDIECVDGRKASEFGYEIFAPSKDTLTFGAMFPGIKYFEVVTPTVRQVAQNHFNCKEMRGMRLENQPTSNDCFGDHWEERLAFDAQMSSVMTKAPIPSYLSPFTLALLEDTGWYKANYTMSRVTSFGHGSGCDFVQKPCIGENDALPDYAKGSFCNTTDKNVFSCDPSHRAIASCDLYDLSNVSQQNYPPIPLVFRQFDNPALGPKRIQQADFCPIFSETFIDCTAPPPSFLVNSKMFLEEEYYGDESRCVNSNFSKPLCLKSYCDEDLGVIWIKIGDYEVKCEFDDQKVDVELAGETYQIECPRRAVLCPEMVCPSDCEGREVCNWDLPLPTCGPRYQGITTMIGLPLIPTGEIVEEPFGSEPSESLPSLNPPFEINDDFSLPEFDDQIFPGVEIPFQVDDNIPPGAADDDGSLFSLFGPTDITQIDENIPPGAVDDDGGLSSLFGSTAIVNITKVDKNLTNSPPGEEIASIDLTGNSTTTIVHSTNLTNTTLIEVVANQANVTIIEEALGNDKTSVLIIEGSLGSNQTDVTVIEELIEGNQTNITIIEETIETNQAEPTTPPIIDTVTTSESNEETTKLPPKLKPVKTNDPTLIELFSKYGIPVVVTNDTSSSQTQVVATATSGDLNTTNGASLSPVVATNETSSQTQIDTTLTNEEPETDNGSPLSQVATSTSSSPSANPLTSSAIPSAHTSELPSISKSSNPTSTSSIVPTTEDAFEFHAGYDSTGYELIKLSDETSIGEIESTCMNIVYCAGFNEKGWLKYKIKDRSDWTTSVPTSGGENPGLYIKKNVVDLIEPFLDEEDLLKDYKFYPQADSLDGDIFKSDGDKNNHAAICQINPYCVGFTSDGWIKHKVKKESEWIQSFSSKSEGLYIKKSTVIPEEDDDFDNEKTDSISPSESISITPSQSISSVPSLPRSISPTEIKTTQSISPTDEDVSTRGSPSSSASPSRLSSLAPSTAPTAKHSAIPSESTVVVNKSPLPSVSTKAIPSALPSVAPQIIPPESDQDENKAETEAGANTGDDSNGAYSRNKSGLWVVSLVLALVFL